MQLNDQNSNTTIKWLIGVLVIIIIGLIGYIVYSKSLAKTDLNNIVATKQTNNESSIENNAKTSSETETPSVPSIDKTTGTVTNGAESWETYSNSKYNFSFNYPSNWEVEIINNSISGSLLSLGIRKVGEKNDYYAGVTVRNGDIDAIVKEVRDQFSNNSNFIDIKNSRISGKYATEIYFENKIDSTIKPVVSLINTNSVIYQISMGSNSSDESANQIIKKIKDSFSIE